MKKPQRVSSEPVIQGKLLQERGDLAGYRINFLVELPQRPLGKQRKNAPLRLGLQLAADDSPDNQDVLKVENVWENGNWDTPVVQHNHEQRLRHQHLYTVQPGDWLTAINDKSTGGAMLTELERKSEPTGTLDLSLMVQRELQDLLGPHRGAPCNGKSGSKASGKLAAGKLPSSRAFPNREKCRSPREMANLLRRSQSSGLPYLRGVPSGNTSSLAWGKFYADTVAKAPRKGTFLPKIN